MSNELLKKIEGLLPEKIKSLGLYGKRHLVLIRLGK